MATAALSLYWSLEAAPGNLLLQETARPQATGEDPAGRLNERVREMVCYAAE